MKFHTPHVGLAAGLLAILIVVLIVALSTMGARTMDPVLPGHVVSSVDQSMPLQYMQDAHAHLSLGEAMEVPPSAWRPLNAGGLNLGFAEGAYWLRATFKPKPAIEDYVLVIGNPHLGRGQIFVLPDLLHEPSIILGEWLIGIEQPQAARPLAGRDFAIPFKVSAQQAVQIIAKVETQGALQVRFKVWDRLSYESWARTQLLLEGLFGGVAAAAALTHLGWSVVSRRALLAWHSAWIACGLALAVVLSGSGYEWLWLDSPHLNQVLPPFVTTVALTLLVRVHGSVLETADSSLRWQVLFWAVAMVSGMVLVVGSAVGVRLAMQAAALTTMVVMLACAVLVALSFSEGNPQAARLFWGFIPVYLTGMLVPLSSLGILGNEDWMSIGALHTVLLWAWSLGSWTVASCVRQQAHDLHQRPEPSLVEGQTSTKRLIEAAQSLQARNAELARLSQTDALTGVHNRRYFDECLAREMERAAITGHEMGVALIDIDHFKRFNDQFGHVAGDACLRAVAQAMVGQLQRRADCLARYGGEEFALILPHTEPAGAEVVCERIRQAVASMQVDVGNRLASVTVSIGLLNCRPNGTQTAQDLTRMADRALYLAKRQGRNRVCVESSNAAPSSLAVLKAPE